MNLRGPVAAALLLATAAVQAAVDLAPFLRRDGFGDIALSPDGVHYAASVVREDRTVLAVVRRADRETVNGFSMGAHVHVTGFEWVDDGRLLVSVAERFGVLETPLSTGELFLVDTKGSRARLLIGFRAGDADRGDAVTAARFSTRPVHATLLHRLPDQPDHVLVEVWPMEDVPRTRVERMNLRTAARTVIAESPVPRATFAADHAGRVRLAVGAGEDNVSRLYHRTDDAAPWVLVNDEARSGVRQFPLGFAADDVTAYLEVEQATGPNAVVAWNSRTGESRTVARDATHDPHALLHSPGVRREPVGVLVDGGGLRAAYFAPSSKAATLYARLEKAFGGDPVRIGSGTDDGTQVIVESATAYNPGDFFLFDIPSGKAERILSRREWLEPRRAAEVVPVALEARDGLAIDGLLTRPRGTAGALPMVVLVHGGPFGVADGWRFDDDAQLLARAGYAVLQVNYRGSGGRGRAFLQAGAREWGRAMQDDITDATRWAIAQGHALAGKVCLVGASYGAYAAMAGLAREPALYACGVGYVGVYDLERMARERRRDNASTALWSDEWVGAAGSLGPVSATTLASAIRAPVLLVAGGRDAVAPPVHTRDMQKALEKAGVKVEALYVPSEGHGFFAEAHRRDYYQRLLDFLARHLGGERAA